MSAQVRNPHSRRSVADAEERTWVGFYDDVDDATVAAELLKFLNANPELKRERSGLYLRARRSVNQARARYNRARRFGQSIRLLFDALCVAPFVLAYRLGHALSMFVIEALPEPQQRDSAARRVSVLKRRPEFAHASTEFDQSERVPQPSRPVEPSGAKAKAA